MEGGWADLPDDILFRILVMLSGKDRQAVCKAAHGVCRSWCHQARAATTDVNINLRRLHNAQLRFGDVWQYVAHFPALSSVKVCLNVNMPSQDYNRCLEQDLGCPPNLESVQQVEQPMTALKQRGPVTDALPNGGPGDERSMAMDEAYEGGLTHENSSASFPGPFLRLLRSLPCLHALCLSGMEFEDISALSSLAQLHALSLAFTTASSVEPLTQLTALTYLRLSSTRVSSIAPLASMTQLQLLDLAWTRVADLQPLSGCKALEALLLRNTFVEGVWALARLVSLQTLDLSYTTVADVSPLSGLTRLRCLKLAGTHVYDLDPLAGLADLRSLVLGSLYIMSLDPLEALPRLETLSLADVEDVDVPVLLRLPALTSLTLSQTQLTARQEAELKRSHTRLSISFDEIDGVDELGVA